MIWPWRKRRPDSEAASGPAPGPTGRIDRLIVQQHDPRQTVTIGGIDTCMRGILDYAPSDETLALVGIDVAGRRKSADGRSEPARPVAAAAARRPRRVVPSRRPDRHRPAQGLPAVLRAARRRPPAVPHAHPPRRDRAGPPGGQRTVRPPAVPRPARLLHPHPGTRAAGADLRVVLAVHRAAPRVDRPGAREAGRAGDRVQPRLRREGAAVEPAHGVRAHLVRPRHHPPGPRRRLARGHLGGPARGSEGPGAGRACLRRAGAGGAGRAVDARDGRRREPASATSTTRSPRCRPTSPAGSRCAVASVRPRSPRPGRAPGCSS